MSQQHSQWRTALSIAGLLLAGCGTQPHGPFGPSASEIAAQQRVLRQRDLSIASQPHGPAYARAAMMTGTPNAMPAANLSSPQLPARTPMPPSQQSAVYSGMNPGVPNFSTASQAHPVSDDSGNIRRITFSNEGSDFDPVVDHSGTWLVFASTRHRETADLYFKKVEGTAVTQLTNDPGNDVMPAISPDGRQIAFASDRAGNWDIYLMDANGGQAVQLTNDPAHEIHPSFSPDGKWLVYCRYGEQSSQWEMVVVELANPSTKRFIGYGMFPSWSPVDDCIVFQKARERGTRWFSIWTIELVNGEAMRPTEIAASANAALITPTFSPDGKHIAFCTVMDSGNDLHAKPVQADIWMIDADGRNRINLTRSQFTNLQPTWARDGTIYFTSNRSLAQGENVWALRPDRAMQMARGIQEPTPGASAPADQATAQVPLP